VTLFAATGSEIPSPARDERLRRAIARLTSLHDGEAGLVDVVALGPVAIPALTEVLFSREPSGLFQARCRAVEALAALKAFSVLGEFLRLGHDKQDPVERLGEDAVVSTAARAIARLCEPWVYELLLDLARRRPLSGVLVGLGSFLRDESLAVFIDALQEDDLRLTAEAILRSFGTKARSALTAAALEREEDPAGESDSHLRKRRSALALLGEIGVPRREWRRLRCLIDDDDHQVALFACEIGLKLGTATDRVQIASRLHALRPTVVWIHRERIDMLMNSLAAQSGRASSSAVVARDQPPHDSKS